MSRIHIAVVSAVCFCGTTLSQTRVVDIKLAAGIDGRDPVGVFRPLAECSTERPESVPVIESSLLSKVYVWTKTASDGDGVIRHVYYVDNVPDDAVETEYNLTDRVLNFLGKVSVSLGFGKTATVTLPFRSSSTWRTWSSKKLSPRVHRGEWKVEITTVDADPPLLCTVYFTVK